MGQPLSHKKVFENLGPEPEPFGWFKIDFYRYVKILLSKVCKRALYYTVIIIFSLINAT